MSSIATETGVDHIPGVVHNMVNNPMGADEHDGGDDSALAEGCVIVEE